MHDDPEVRKRCQLGVQCLSHPLKARMLGATAVDFVPQFALQATGFTGLTVAEGVKNGITFEIFGKAPKK